MLRFIRNRMDGSDASRECRPYNEGEATRAKDEVCVVEGWNVVAWRRSRVTM